MPAFQLGLVHLYYFLYVWIISLLARFGLAKPVKVVSEPKMKIEELKRRHEKMNGINGTNGMSVTNGMN